MSVFEELNKLFQKTNDEIVKEKKKKMKMLPGWHGLDTPHAGSAGISESENMNELKDFYEKRTERHIGLVNKYSDLIKEKFNEFSNIEFDDHDASKYKEPEYTPYLHITWKYKCQNDGSPEYQPPEGMEDKMKNASNYHITHNRHHPEYWVDGDINNIEDPFDVTEMSNVAIAEMVADWCAMSEEIGKNTPREWADDNIGKKWKFDEIQKELIYKLINNIWDVKKEK